MINKMKIKYILLILTIFQFGCDNNAPIYNPPEIIKFFPLKVGNYWVYEFNLIDEGLKTVPGSESIDSFVVVTKQTFIDKTAFIILRYNNNKLIDTFYLSKDKNQLFRLNNGLTDSIQSLGLAWFKIGDMDLNSWNIFADIAIDSNFVFENKKVIVNKHITINGTKLGFEKMQFHKDSITVLPFVIKEDRKTYFDYYLYNDTTKTNIEIINLKNERMWLNNNIGIYLWQLDPSSEIVRDSSNRNNPLRKITFNGWKRQLIRYRACLLYTSPSP
ncbi:MAG: hypothetical protein N2319_13655, partial [Candidatus Kapabacteria bacterium]|nr:hypothetical protein [Candidatus Kapabacteria bacterium]